MKRTNVVERARGVSSKSEHRLFDGIFVAKVSGNVGLVALRVDEAGLLERQHESALTDFKPNESERTHLDE